jgi:hypothetical protein
MKKPLPRPSRDWLSITLPIEVWNEILEIMDGEREEDPAVTHRLAAEIVAESDEYIFKASQKYARFRHERDQVLG